MVLSLSSVDKFNEWYAEALTNGGTILVDKPIEWTSFGVCGKLRGMMKIKKVGHAGTLDPLATGLLIICLGKHTKQISNYQDQRKEYAAVIKIGATTKTDDSEGEEQNIKPFEHIENNQIVEVINSFVGEIQQVPPMFSAIKVDGQRLYKKARKDEFIEIQPRSVVIDNITIQKIELPFIEIKVNCSKGTYIRALARDIGEKLETGAYLKSLRRTKIGEFEADDAMGIEQLNVLTNNYRENERL